MAFADVEQPATFAARRELALRIRDELEIPLPIFIDGMDDASRALFSDLPSPAFVIDREGKIVDKLPWADPEPLRQSIDRAVAASTIPDELAASWTVDQRDAFARAALARGDAAAALAWLDATPDEAPCVPPTLVAVARAAIARTQAVAAGKAPGLPDQVASARAAIVAAWGKDKARMVAALAELARAVADHGDVARALWQEARRQLETRAPEQTRTFLDQQARAR